MLAANISQFVPLTTEETQKLFTELKAKYPADFTVTPAQAMAWHREQLDDAARDQDWFAVAFHLRVLLREYAFADVELMTRLRAAEAKLTPREVLPPPRGI